MPVISQFYGIVIQIFFDENGKHHEKHICVRYNAVLHEEGEFFKTEPLN